MGVWVVSTGPIRLIFKAVSLDTQHADDFKMDDGEWLPQISDAAQHSSDGILYGRCVCLGFLVPCLLHSSCNGRNHDPRLLFFTTLLLASLASESESIVVSQPKKRSRKRGPTSSVLKLKDVPAVYDPKVQKSRPKAGPAGASQSHTCMQIGLVYPCLTRS